MTFMMGTETPKQRVKREAFATWEKTLPVEHDGLILDHDGYGDSDGNLILPIGIPDTGKTVEQLFAELDDIIANEGFGD